MLRRRDTDFMTTAAPFRRKGRYALPSIGTLRPNGRRQDDTKARTASRTALIGTRRDRHKTGIMLRQETAKGLCTETEMHDRIVKKLLSLVRILRRLDGGFFYKKTVTIKILTKKPKKDIMKEQF